MAGALVAGLLKAGVSATSIRVADCSQAQCDRLAVQWGVFASTSAKAVLDHADAVIWAVKPQVLQVAMQDGAAFCKDALHISVAAGIPVSSMATWLGSGRLVRAMPNTSALVSAGVTGLFAEAVVNDEDRNASESILRCVGDVFWVASEEEMDAVTAVSGSGPAYVFHFLEAFQRAAEGVGFDEKRSRALALKVAAGAVQQASESAESFEALRQRVTSKGGTTEAAITVLERFQARDTLVRAVRAAAERSRSLAARPTIIT